MTATMRVPFDIGPTGRIGRADTPYDVANQHLKVIILTRLTERIMRAGYGTEVRDSLFDVVDETAMVGMEAEIRDAVREWEPAINIREVRFSPVGSVVQVDVVYSLTSIIGSDSSLFSVEIDVGGSVEETNI